MSYQLRSGLSCCEVDGRLVFLDLEQDRYFRITDRLAAALSAVLSGRACGEADVDALVRADILAPAPADRAPPPAVMALPSRSALEHRAQATAGVAAVLEVGALLAWSRMQLKTRRLDRVLASLIHRRERMTSGASPGPVRPGDDVLVASALFHHARTCVPLEPCCLPDAIALVRFLARRGLHAGITFGVTLDPFAAHCWTQAGEWVLDDTVGNAITHTPIRSL